MTLDQRQALPDRCEEIERGLGALAAKRSQFGQKVYNECRDELLGEIDGIEFELGVD